MFSHCRRSEGDDRDSSSMNSIESSYLGHGPLMLIVDAKQVLRLALVNARLLKRYPSMDPAIEPHVDFMSV